MRRRGLDPLGARLRELDRVGLAEGTLGLCDPSAHAVAGHAPREDDVAVGPRHAGAAVGEALHHQLELVARAGAVLRLRSLHRGYGGSLDVDAYRSEAEAFLGELDREFYLHFSGQQDEYGIEAVYESHSRLFERRPWRSSAATTT